MGAKLSVLGLTLYFTPYLRSAMVRFPLPSQLYWAYIFPYCPVDEAIGIRIDPVENSVVAALGITHGQESNTGRAKVQYYPF